VKNYGCHVCEPYQKLKLTTVVHHDDRVVDEGHMTQSIGSIAAKKEVC